MITHSTNCSHHGSKQSVRYNHVKVTSISEIHNAYQCLPVFILYLRAKSLNQQLSQLVTLGLTKFMHIVRCTRFTWHYPTDISTGFILVL